MIPGRLAALAALLLLSPFLLLLAAGLLLTQGRPLLYAGTRIGLDGLPFTVYKLRTMKNNAEKELHGVVCTSVAPVTPMGRFLRICRLDEIPQLWNVVNGSMAWFGPRPMRHSVYLQNLKEIPNYHKRLWVQPGLFGPTQVYLPHGAHKRIRFLFYCLSFFGKRRWTLSRKCGLVTATSLALILKSSNQFRSALQTVFRNGSLRERRRGNRTSPYFDSTLKAGKGSWRIIEADEFTLTLLGSDTDIPTEGRIHMIIRNKNKLRHRRARCLLQPVRVPENGAEQGGRLVMRYAAASGKANFVIERYLLRKTIL